MSIIAFAGRKQSGKTTSAEFVQTLFNSTSFGECRIYNFADPLKTLCIDILGLEYRQCYGTDTDKNELVDCHWDNKQLTAREVLQIVGTDMFRKMQHNVWSAATIRKIKKEKPDLAIIADCRFPNEVDAVKSADGIVIKLTRNPYNSYHESEVALDTDQYDQSSFDLVVDNSKINITEQNKIIYNFLQQRGVLSL
jgi:cytidylate kinase